MILYRFVPSSKISINRRLRLSIAVVASLVLLTLTTGATSLLFGAPISQNRDTSNETLSETGKPSQVRLRQTRPLVITLNPDNVLSGAEQITVTLNVINRFVLIDGVVTSATMEIEAMPISGAVVAAEVIEPLQQKQSQPTPRRLSDLSHSTPTKEVSSFAAVRPTSRPTVPLPTQTPVPDHVGQRFEIDQRVASERIEDIALSVRDAVLQPDSLALDVAFENRTEEPVRFSFISQLEEQSVRLSDASGNNYQPIEIEQSLAAVQPIQGFAPGGANVGQIVFPSPKGPGPYRLQGLLDFAPIEFYLNSPAPQIQPTTIPGANYPIDIYLYSTHDVLKRLELHIKSVDILTDQVVFLLSFTNRSLERFGLNIGPTGSDAWLLDSTRRQYQPITLSASLKRSITPPEGLAPGEEYLGTITFARPESLSELRFLFTQYTPLLLRFNETGLLDARIASATGDVPLVSRPTPSPESLAHRQLTQLLENQSRSLTTADQALYLATFAPEIQNGFSSRFERMKRMPFDSIMWTLKPGADFISIFHTAHTGNLENIPIQIRYTLQGIGTEDQVLQNEFVHDFEADFQLRQGGWVITDLQTRRNPPYWWEADFVLYETEHFLLFVRPDSGDDVVQLQIEAEAAYRSLESQGLPLESRYVAHVTGPNDHFGDLTGMPGDRFLGVAHSRFDIRQDQIHVIGRSFYINGPQFLESGQPKDERLKTFSHELTHLALAQDSRPFTPPWLSEGLSIYYAMQNNPERWSRLVEEGKLNQVNLTVLTRLDSLGQHDFVGNQTGIRYIYSGAIIHYLIETFGEAQILAFYQAYAELPASKIQERFPSDNNQLCDLSQCRFV